MRDEEATTQVERSVRAKAQMQKDIRVYAGNKSICSFWDRIKSRVIKS